MSEKVANIAKNTSYFTIALVLQKVISFTYFALIARALAPDDLGKYYFAISFTSIFSIFIDIGLANLLTREIAKPFSDKNENREMPELYRLTNGQDKTDYAGKLLGAMMTIKIPTSLLSFLMVVIAINLLDYPPLTKNLVYLSSICMILDSFTMTLFSIIRGFHNLLYESIAAILFQVIVLSTGLLMLRLDLGLFWLMLALVAASTFNLIYSSTLIFLKFRLKFWPLFDLKVIKYLITLSIPFALFGVFQKLFTYLDSVLLNILAGDEYTGYYQIAFKILNALQFLPLAFVATLYPAFSSYWHNNREQLSVSFERAMNYLILISLPISIGVISIADKVILIFSEQYAEAVLPLQIIMSGLLFVFIGFPVGALLNACDRQKKNTRNIGIVLAVSVVMNLILIPKFNVIGASITVVAANALMFFLGMVHVPGIINYSPGKNILFFLKTLGAAGVMGLTAFYLKPHLNVFLVVLVSGLVYAMLVYVSGAIKREDVASILNSFFKKTV